MPTAPASGVSFTVKTNGQILSVAAGTSASSLVQTLYSDAACTASVTTPATITSDTTYYLPLDVANVAHYISCKQMDGTELWGKKQHLGGITIEPSPSQVQIASDLNRRDLSLAPAGVLAETYPRMAASSANTSVLVSARLHLTAVYLPAGLTVTNISYTSITQAAVAPTAWWFALYSSGLALRGQTADQTSTAWAANTTKTVALSTPYVTTTPGLHYLGICVVAGTVPSLAGISPVAGVLGIAPIVNGYADTGLTTTAPATAAAMTSFASVPYAYVS